MKFLEAATKPATIKHSQINEKRAELEFRLRQLLSEFSVEQDLMILRYETHSSHRMDSGLVEVHLEIKCDLADYVDDGGNSLNTEIADTE